jgi:hypothetical protein
VTHRPERILTEAEARALWERAARLQAEAVTRRVPVEADDDEAAELAGEAGLALGTVRQAALEAGIDPSFVDEALVELDESGPSRRVDRWADAFLGEDTPVARCTRVVEASLDETYLALQRVLPRVPFDLVLRRVEGPDPRRGGVLVFEVPYAASGSNGLTMTGPTVDIRHYADFRELRVRLRAVDPDGEVERTEVEITASRTHARRVNYWTGQVFGGLVGTGGAVMGSLLTAGLMAVGGPIEAMAMLGVGGAVGLGGLFGTGRAWRRVYRWGQKKGETALERILDAIELDMRTDGAFSAGNQARKELGDADGGLPDLSSLLGG